MLVATQWTLKRTRMCVCVFACQVFYFGDIYQMPFCICNYIELLFINKYVCKVITHSPIDQTMSPVLGQLPNILCILCNVFKQNKYTEVCLPINIYLPLVTLYIGWTQRRDCHILLGIYRPQTWSWSVSGVSFFSSGL